MSGNLVLYGDSRSGNCYKIRWLAAELGLDYDWRDVDILAGDTRTAEFLAMNPNGKIPLLELPDGRHLAESNAIMCYLADGHSIAGEDAWTRARVLQWLFFEQYSHEPYIATSRFIVQYLGNPPDKQAALEEKREPGYRALGVMERQLSASDGEYLLGSSLTLADIALFAYTHVADEGGFDLARYDAINAWMATVRARPKFVAMAAPRE